VTSPSVSVVVPVRNGARFLDRVLDAVRSQGEVELVVVDSGSVDRSRDIARRHDALLARVAPGEFRHGDTRNRAAEATSGDLICFLSQDAVPLPGWLSAYRTCFESNERVGAAFGPHRPRADTSPIIARELVQFFDGMTTNRGPTVHTLGSTPFLSNVNACYRRTCWSQVRFADVDYAEDQAFGARMLELGWLKMFHPEAAVEHAHDYSVINFFRRYFDEYRALNNTLGHQVSASPRAALAETVRAARADGRWAYTHGTRAPRIAPDRCLRRRTR
jgi:glycosyltransferase involved in cell wall biosynthesis